MSPQNSALPLPQDCPTSPHTSAHHSLPSGLFDSGEVLGFFSREFGFTREEAVAALGAHTLGNAKARVSGFKGTWVPGGRHTLDNMYFQVNMLNGLHEMFWAFTAH